MRLVRVLLLALLMNLPYMTTDAKDASRIDVRLALAFVDKDYAELRSGESCDVPEPEDGTAGAVSVFGHGSKDEGVVNFDKGVIIKLRVNDEPTAVCALPFQLKMEYSESYSIEYGRSAVADVDGPALLKLEEGAVIPLEWQHAKWQTPAGFDALADDWPRGLRGYPQPDMVIETGR